MAKEPKVLLLYINQSPNHSSQIIINLSKMIVNIYKNFSNEEAFNSSNHHFKMLNTLSAPALH